MFYKGNFGNIFESFMPFHPVQSCDTTNSWFQSD